MLMQRKCFQTKFSGLNDTFFVQYVYVYAILLGDTNKKVNFRLRKEVKDCRSDGYIITIFPGMTEFLFFAAKTKERNFNQVSNLNNWI